MVCCWINCARGGIYDEDAVLRGLKSGKIGGAAFDVYPVEPPPPEAPLLHHERVICTPHLGASTHEAQERVAVEIAEQVIDFLDSGATKNALNVPAMSGELAEKVAPWVVVAERLGAFLAQVEPLVPSAFEIECVGDAGAHGLEAVSSGAVSGFLQHYLDVPVNAISAPHLAADRGITIRELHTRPGSSPHASKIRVRIVAENGDTRFASGCLGSDRTPRLLSWGDFDIEARLGGNALVVASADVPGVIGFLGTTLGDAGVNVASVFLGKAPNGALSMWNLDVAPPSEVVDAISASDNVSRALVITL